MTSTPSSVHEVIQQIESGQWTVDEPKAAMYGCTLAHFRYNGKTPKFQLCGSKPPHVFTFKGILDSVVDGPTSESADLDGPRRSICFQITDPLQQAVLRRIEQFGKDAIKANYKTWKKPLITRTEKTRQRMIKDGEDPDDIEMDEIEQAFAYRPNASSFATPLLQENVPNPKGGFYQPSMKAKVNVRPAANGLPACAFVSIYEKDGKKFQKPLDYHELCAKPADTIPILQPVGIMFKGDQCRILISVEKLYKTGDGNMAVESTLRVDEDDVAPIEVDASALPPADGENTHKRPLPDDDNDGGRPSQQAKHDHISTESDPSKQDSDANTFF